MTPIEKDQEENRNLLTKYYRETHENHHYTDTVEYEGPHYVDTDYESPFRYIAPILYKAFYLMRKDSDNALFHILLSVHRAAQLPDGCVDVFKALGYDITYHHIIQSWWISCETPRPAALDELDGSLQEDIARFEAKHGFLNAMDARKMWYTESLKRMDRILANKQ